MEKNEPPLPPMNSNKMLRAKLSIAHVLDNDS